MDPCGGFIRGRAHGGGYRACPVRTHEHPPDVLGVVGCIPLIPGALASKALLGLFALTRTPTVTDTQILFDAVQDSLRVVFTMFAIGTGMAVPVAAVRFRSAR